MEKESEVRLFICCKNSKTRIAYQWIKASPFYFSFQEWYGWLYAMKRKPENFILDLDGVMTDGRFYYTTKGKMMKVFGSDDHDALVLLRPYLNIIFITGDRKGFEISKKRIVDDMKFPLELVSTFERVEWMLKQGLDPKASIYMGDGIFDAMVFVQVAYGIAPANAFYTTKERAHFVTRSVGGKGAVAEACLHILKKFFVPFDPLHVIVKKGTGEWKKGASNIKH
jgi:3-deoxy-D-manno-octulosonate 8-phosphate phosphatase (KDO 8-P phosphatase)